MKKKKAGRIINITSPASRMALPNYTAYAASKRPSMRSRGPPPSRLRRDGIRVNSVAPGMMGTPMQRLTEQQLARIEDSRPISARSSPNAPPASLGNDEPEEVAEDRVVACLRCAGLHHRRTAECVGRTSTRIDQAEDAKAVDDDPKRRPRLPYHKGHDLCGRCALAQLCLRAHRDRRRHLRHRRGLLEFQPKAVEAASSNWRAARSAAPRSRSRSSGTTSCATNSCVRRSSTRGSRDRDRLSTSPAKP